MESCRVSAEEIAHDRPAGDYSAAHREKTMQLMRGMFDPFSNDNFACFFTADLSNAQMQTLFVMRDALKEGKLEAAAVLFQKVLTGFYISLASDEAAHQMINAYCRVCYDSGCPKCAPEIE